MDTSTTWVHLKCTILSKENQCKKVTYFMISSARPYGKDTTIGREKRSMVPRSKKGPSRGEDENKGAAGGHVRADDIVLHPDFGGVYRNLHMCSNSLNYMLSKKVSFIVCKSFFWFGKTSKNPQRHGAWETCLWHRAWSGRARNGTQIYRIAEAALLQVRKAVTQGRTLSYKLYRRYLLFNHVGYAEW